VRARAAFEHRFQVFDGAVDEAAGALAARDRRHEGSRTGGEHQLVVGQHLAVGQGDGLRGAVDLATTFAFSFRSRLVRSKKPGATSDRSSAEVPGEEFGQVHAVVGRTRLFAQHGDVEGGGAGVREQGFEEFVAHHAVADDDEFHARAPSLCRAGAGASVAVLLEAHADRAQRRRPAPGRRGSSGSGARRRCLS
jgi:hypothetical protein